MRMEEAAEGPYMRSSLYLYQQKKIYSLLALGFFSHSVYELLFYLSNKFPFY